MASKVLQDARDGQEVPGGGEGRLNVRPPSLQPASGMSGGVRGYQTWPLRPIAASPQTRSRQGAQACRNEPAADAQAVGSQSASERLEAFVAGCGDQPSQRLCSWLNVCGPELADQIRCNILAMADSLFAPSAQFMRLPLQEQQGRKEETSVVVKLFYKLLEGQLSYEEQRKPSSDFAPLLNSAPFRKSLFACCAVLTAAAYGTPFLDHTAVVEKLGITAFDMGRNIEMLVKACPDLPPEFREHLLAVEEEVLELRAWQAGSSFYSFVINADRCLRSLQAGPSSGKLQVVVPCCGCCCFSVP
ncbi:unnamed protein product [Ostreobium quekettii]|uniref:Retinoblastoma-associated protein A-box domain-containing protein n=1 Tax=Ostreobium quekettii TaxID=121088 RepID=A0A8S1IYE4_9CHLO|nr:unnamed protein product [Ostreobium quekettii]